MADVEVPNPQDVKDKAEDPFLKVVALFVAIYAVGLAVSSFGGQNAAKEMLMMKQNETLAENLARQDEFNIWNQFQSKSTRESLYRNERTQLEFEKKGNPNFPPFKDELLAQYIKDEARMKADKEELAEKARKINEAGKEKLKEVRVKLNRCERKDPYFDFAEVAYQLAIVLSSVAMLAEKRWAFIVSFVMFALAVCLTINGFGLFLVIPGIDDGPAPLE